MHGDGSGSSIKKSAGDIAVDLCPFLRLYQDGRIERLVPNVFVPPSVHTGLTGVATRDVVMDVNTGVSARLFLPSCTTSETGRKLPLILYFHGGAFCTGSAFSQPFHRYAASLSAHTGALVVSVDYGLAPEHPIPAAYNDAWAALLWATTLCDPWITNYADPSSTLLAGESAGANIAQNLVLRASSTTLDGKGIVIKGLILLQPFFWGTQRLPYEMDHRHDGLMFAPERVDNLWPFVTAGTASNDDPRLNPPSEQVVALRCRRVLVAVAGNDVMLDRGRRYAAQLRGGGGWSGEVTLLESEGEDHCFHLLRPSRPSATTLMDHVALFVNQAITTAASVDNKNGTIPIQHVVQAQINVPNHGGLLKAVSGNRL